MCVDTLHFPQSLGTHFALQQTHNPAHVRPRITVLRTQHSLAYVLVNAPRGPPHPGTAATNMAPSAGAAACPRRGSSTASLVLWLPSCSLPREAAGECRSVLPTHAPPRGPVVVDRTFREEPDARMGDGATISWVTAPMPAPQEPSEPLD